MQERSAHAAPGEASTTHPLRFSGRAVSLSTLASGVIQQVEEEYLLDRRGRALAVIQLLGSDVAILPEHTLLQRLTALARSLEHEPTPLMRLSWSAPQPLSPYLDGLEPRYRAQISAAKDAATPLAEVARAMQTLSANGQARVCADYWVLTYPLTLTDWRPGRGRAAAQGALCAALADRCATLLWHLARAGIRARRVTGGHLAALCRAAWSHPTLPLEELEYLDQDARDRLVRQPEGAVLVGAQAIQTASGYVRSFAVQDFGGPLSPALFLALLREPGVRVLQFAELVPAHKAKHILRFNRTIEGSQHSLRPASGVRDFDAEARMFHNDAQRARLAYGEEQVFCYHALIQLWAASLEELEEHTRALRVQLEHAELRVVPTLLRQREALLAGLPVAACPIDKPERNLDASSLARLVYPGPADPLQPSGIWLGQEVQSGLLVTTDFFALQNPVVELVGMMGAGKSLAQKSFLTQYAAQGYPIYILDGAQHEYRHTVEALGGVVIPLGHADGPGFNPVAFDPADAQQEGDPFLIGQGQWLDWVEAALRPLSEVEQAVLEDAYLRALSAAGIERDDPTTWDRPIPLLADVQAALLEEPPDPELAGTEADPRSTALCLARLFRSFTTGPAAPLFNRPTELPDSDAQILCFDLFDVPRRLRLPFFQQVLAFIGRQTLRHRRYLGSVAVLDEAHLLLEEERAARELEQLVRQGRKAKLLTFFTQHTVADSQVHRSAQLAHLTAGATLVFHLNPQDEGTLTALHLPPHEQALVTPPDLPEGQCLLLAPFGHLLVQIGIPPAWYDRFTTKPDEVRVLLGERARGDGDGTGPRLEEAPRPWSSAKAETIGASGEEGDAPGDGATRHRVLSFRRHPEARSRQRPHTHASFPPEAVGATFSQEHAWEGRRTP